jgi:hypothetical protein
MGKTLKTTLELHSRIFRHTHVPDKITPIYHRGISVLFFPNTDILNFLKEYHLSMYLQTLIGLLRNAHKYFINVCVSYQSLQIRVFIMKRAEEY